MQYFFRYLSPLGGITVTSNGTAITGLWFDGQKYSPNRADNEYKEVSLPVFEQVEEWLNLYFAGNVPNFTPALSFHSTPFRTIVWNLLLQIPYGQTTTYKSIADITARQMGMEKMSAQAVGGAVGHNPISLIIPCHRVIGSTGNLTGYAGGLERKQYLLSLEKEHVKVTKS